MTFELAAKGDLKEAFMLHHSLCEIWHLWSKPIKLCTTVKWLMLCFVSKH